MIVLSIDIAQFWSQLASSSNSVKGALKKDENDREAVSVGAHVHPWLDGAMGSPERSLVGGVASFFVVALTGGRVVGSFVLPFIWTLNTAHMLISQCLR